MKRSFALFAAWLAPALALGQNVLPTTSPQDSQIAYREMLCCSPGMPPTSTEIPTIGCFGVPSGGNSRGIFDGHQFAVAVDSAGEPKRRLDGAAAECAGCIGVHAPNCPVMLIIVSRNAVGLVQRAAKGGREQLSVPH